ncbi:MAG: Bro-N domain-containing protein [Ruminococcus sp.]
MNELKVFQNSEFGELGILLIDGKEYFPATQCAKVLGYADPYKAIKAHCKGWVNRPVPTNGGTQEIKYITEGDLYRLIIRSKLPAAERFERWVFDEVLPALRKNGSYGNVNLEEVIAKAVTMAVSETVRQIVPAIVKSMQEQPKQIIRKQIEHRYQYRTPSKISLLPPALKEKVEEMILSGDYSCQQIANYITNNSGIPISQMAVNRYKHQNFFCR